MDHLFILLRVAAYTVGVVNVVAMAIIYFLFRYRAVLLSVILMVPFTIVLIAEGWLTYISVNGLPASMRVAPALVASFGVGLMVAFLPYFSHTVADGTVSRRQLGTFIGAGVGAFLLGAAPDLGVGPPAMNAASLVILGIAIVYSSSYGIVQHRRARTRRYGDIVRISILVARSMIVFLPLLVVFDFFHYAIPWIRDNVPSTVTVLPIFYLYWNTLLLTNALTSLRRITDGSAFDPTHAATEFQLTNREAEVLVHLVRGGSYAEIADALCVSLATVKTHVNRIYRKTGAKSRPELMNRLRPVETASRAVNRSVDFPS